MAQCAGRAAPCAIVRAGPAGWQGYDGGGNIMPRTREQIADVVARVLAAAPHAAHGLTAVAVAEGEARLEFVAGPNSWGPNGDVHGGVLAMLIEAAAVCAVLSALEPDRHAVTADMHVQHMRPTRPGARIELTARVLRAGRSLAFCEAQVLDDGKVCSVARLTKAVVAAP